MNKFFYKTDGNDHKDHNKLLEITGATWVIGPTGGFKLS